MIWTGVGLCTDSAAQTRPIHRNSSSCLITALLYGGLFFNSNLDKILIMEAAQTPRGTIRNFNLALDGEVVANLIEEAFCLTNDPDGQGVLIQMRESARRLKQTKGVQFPPYVSGFVWEVDGCVVGNISILPYASNAHRLHLVANVAVDPAFRGQGIGTALTIKALQFSRQTGVRKVWLQVKQENQVAIRMYQKLGFQKGHSHDTWKKSEQPGARNSSRHFYPSLYEVRPREYADWQLQKQWLDINYPRAARWYSSLDFGALSPWAWLNPLQWLNAIDLRQFSLFAGDELAAVLSQQRTVTRSDNLYIAAPFAPTEGEYVGALLNRFLQEDWSGKPLSVDYPAGRASGAFEANGFTLARTLLWMHTEN